MIKAVLFARVSSREQEETGYSLPSQEKLLVEYTEKKSFSIGKKFAISESAGGKHQRETFNEMMAYVEKYKIKVIICEKVDRLTRNFKDAVLIDEWLEEDEERQVHLVKDSLILHKNSRSQEKLNWGVRILFAKNYIDNLSEEVKKGQKEKLQQGWLPAKARLGYKTIGEKGHKTHVPDEHVAPMIRRMFELYATGDYSVKKLVSILYAEGLRTRDGNKVQKSRMHYLLGDPFYCGKNTWNGKEYDGKHEPLVSIELFQAVQAKLTRKTGSPMYRKHSPLFKAKITCEECSGMITWEIQKGHWYGHHSDYYKYKQCSKKSYIREEKVEEQLFPYFEAAAPKNDRLVQWLEKALKESHSDKIEYSTVQREQLNQSLARVEKRLEAIYEDKIDCKITVEFYERKFKEYTTESLKIVEELEKLNNANTKYYEAGYAIHELACKAKEIYQSPLAKVEEKRMLLGYAFSGITLKKDKITPIYSPAFKFLVEWMPKLNPIFEQTKNPANSEVLVGVSGLTPLKEQLESTESRNNFRTSANPQDMSRSRVTSVKSAHLLAWQDAFRTFDWAKALPYPEVQLTQIRQLLALA